MDVLWRVLQRLALRVRAQSQLLFFLGVVAVGAILVSTGRFQLSPPPPAPPESGTVAVAAPAGSTEAAIQQLIIRGNRQQERAIALRDSSPMRETSTDAYYREVERANREMLDGGVTRIELISLDWGEVTVRGDSATATTWETWTVTFDDGSTGQSRDRNVYGLVRSSGAWRIEADDHPDS
ncbi:MAG: hypothetical protein HY534_07895 [Chloroflexi bacterium]|nr:hypothetical protein [Chloroflexota bacterium]